MEVRQTNVFTDWLKNLKDNLAKYAIISRIERLKKGNFGDSKGIGDSVFEMRIDVSKGYRVYFMNENDKIVLLLVGGNKSTQEKDIKRSKEMAKEARNDRNNSI